MNCAKGTGWQVHILGETSVSFRHAELEMPVISQRTFKFEAWKEVRLDEYLGPSTRLVDMRRLRATRVRAQETRLTKKRRWHRCPGRGRPQGRS